MAELSHDADLQERLIRHLDAGERLQSHFLVARKAQSIKEMFTDEVFPIMGAIDFPSIQVRLQQYAALTSPLLELLVVGCFGGDKAMIPTWVSTIEFISEYPQTFHQHVFTLKRLRLYPALLLAYGSGVAAVAGGNYETLTHILTKTYLLDPSKDEEQALSLHLYPGAILEDRYASGIFVDEPEPRDFNSHLRRAVRPAFSGVIPSDHKFNKAFDQFEALFALTYTDLKWADTDNEVRWVPPGSFHRRRGNLTSAWETLKAEADTDGEYWQPLQAGLFQGSFERYNELKRGIDQFFSRTNIC